MPCSGNTMDTCSANKRRRYNVTSSLVGWVHAKNDTNCWSGIPQGWQTLAITKLTKSLQWRHNEYHGITNHQPHDCSLNRLFRRRSKKAPKLRVTGLCVGNSPVTGEFPAQRSNNAENVSIWWRHHIIVEHQSVLVYNAKDILWHRNESRNKLTVFIMYLLRVKIFSMRHITFTTDIQNEEQ